MYAQLIQIGKRLLQLLMRSEISRLISIMWWQSFVPVSYTHLDVYKRQLWKSGADVFLSKDGETFTELKAADYIPVGATLNVDGIK